MIGQNNFTDIDGFNAAPRRDRPGLRAAVAGALLAALAWAGWSVLPYVAAVILTVAP
jgi:hypothetical protein